MISYPSGHTGSAFTAGVFLALYLNAKLKSFSDYKTSFWKMIAVSAPIIGAMLVAAGLTIDHVSPYFFLLYLDIHFYAPILPRSRAVIKALPHLITVYLDPQL